MYKIPKWRMSFQGSGKIQLIAFTLKEKIMRNSQPIFNNSFKCDDLQKIEAILVLASSKELTLVLARWSVVNWYHIIVLSLIHQYFTLPTYYHLWFQKKNSREWSWQKYCVKCLLPNQHVSLTTTHFISHYNCIWFIIFVKIKHWLLLSTIKIALAMVVVSKLIESFFYCCCCFLLILVTLLSIRMLIVRRGSFLFNLLVSFGLSIIASSVFSGSMVQDPVNIFH